MRGWRWAGFQSTCMPVAPAPARTDCLSYGALCCCARPGLPFVQVALFIRFLGGCGRWPGPESVSRRSWQAAARCGGNQSLPAVL